MGAATVAPEPPASPVSTGNRVAQFIFLTAMFCAFYQLVSDDESGSPLGSPASSSPAPAPSPLVGRGDEDDGPAPAAYRREDTRHMTASECTCFLACLGLFGLLRRNKKKSELEKRQQADDEDVALQRALLLSRKEIARQRGCRGSGALATNAAGGSVQENPKPLSATTSAIVTDLSTSCAGSTSSFSPKSGAATFESLPDDVVMQVLLCLTPKELATQYPLVCRSWDQATGDDADALWQLVLLRDFGERGERFRAVFPVDCWRQFYFRHRVSRAVELARLLDLTEQRKCVVIENQVYDVTAFIDSHPGGAHVIGDVVGTDATDLWDQFQHSAEAKDMMKDFLVFDPILACPELMRGTLQHVATQWRRFSWCLAQSHCFGSMSGAFESVMLRFHSRPRQRRRANR